MSGKNDLYTFVLEYKGGTYISQIEASTPRNALIKWSANLRVDEVAGLGEKTKRELRTAAKSEVPVAVKTMINTWCWIPLTERVAVFVNFMKTCR